MGRASYIPGELIPLPLSGSIPELPHVAEVGCLGWIAVSLRSRTGFDLPALRLSTQLRHYAVHRTDMAAAGQPAMRAAASSGRWQQEQTRPGRLAGLAVEADRASGCASNVRTASRSSCGPVATAQNPQYQQTTARCRGHAHGCREGSCVPAPLGSTAV